MKKTTLSIIALFVSVAFVCAQGQMNSKTTTPSKDQHGLTMTPSKAITTLHSDGFEWMVDTSSITTAGYLHYYRSSPLGTTTWFAGNTTVFTAMEGAAYIGANFNNTSGAGTIDTWLVLPSLSILAGDSIAFYQRSPDGSTYPDDIKIMYNPAGDVLPESTNWVEIATFTTSTAGWARVQYSIPTTSTTGRLAIRYYVTNGGPSGANSDYIGVDALSVYRYTVGVNENNHSNTSIYPVPANNVLNVKVAGTSKVEIVNVLGDVVYKNGNVVNNVTINTSAFQSGVYFVKISNGTSVETQKIQIIR
ncbi:MAG: choice-of-anchor J domain-containing protein [Bacteroidota bacterium]